MKTLKTLSIALTLAIVAAVTMQATYQYQLSQTTLNGAVTATATSVVLTSASKSTNATETPAVGQCLYVDYELMRITAISSTTFSVQRAFGQGTTVNGAATAHASGARVFTGACNRFQNQDPPLGTCLSANMTGPWVNVKTGNVWLCPADTNYVVTNTINITYNSPGLP